MSLAAWLAKAGAMGKKGLGSIEDLVRGKEEFNLGRPAGFEFSRKGGMFGEGGMADQAAEGLGELGDKMGAGADKLEQFIDSHPHLAAGAAGLAGGAIGGAGYMAAQDNGDDDDQEELRELLARRRGRGM